MAETLKPIFVGLLGAAGSGKTTTLKAMLSCDNPDHQVVPMSFAGPIRDSLAWVGVKKDSHPDLYRRLAQTLGAECRAANEDWWVTRQEIAVGKALGKINDAYNMLTIKVDTPLVEEGKKPVFVWDDVRYPNELLGIQEMARRYSDRPPVFVVLDAGARINWGEPFRAHESEALAAAINDRSYRTNLPLHIADTFNSEPESVALLIFKLIGDAHDR